MAPRWSALQHGAAISMMVVGAYIGTRPREKTPAELKAEEQKKAAAGGGAGGATTAGQR